MSQNSTPEDRGDASDASAISDELLASLRCPETHAPLTQHGNELWCRESGRAFPIVGGIPVLLLEESRRLGPSEVSTTDAS